MNMTTREHFLTHGNTTTLLVGRLRRGVKHLTLCLPDFESKTSCTCIDSDHFHFFVFCMKTAAVHEQLSERCPNIFVLLEFVLHETQVGIMYCLRQGGSVLTGVCLFVCLSVFLSVC